MIKRTLYFGNPTYLSLRNEQLIVKLPEVEVNDSLPEIVDKSEYSALNKMEKSIDGVMIKNFFVKLKVDRLGNITI